MDFSQYAQQAQPCSIFSQTSSAICPQKRLPPLQDQQTNAFVYGVGADYAISALDHSRQLPLPSESASPLLFPWPDTHSEDINNDSTFHRRNSARQEPFPLISTPINISPITASELYDIFNLNSSSLVLTSPNIPNVTFRWRAYDLSDRNENNQRTINPTEERDCYSHHPLLDKPYAQLIWEALMQAPGKRMLLRDIYSWFLENTTKPSDSGSKGWQNSIRHNLSMNKAFENDKTETASLKGSRKANSVWFLTENAVKHGVQSTTRYRKSSTSKRNLGNEISTKRRQRSGIKGRLTKNRVVTWSSPHESLQAIFDLTPSMADSAQSSNHSLTHRNTGNHVPSPDFEPLTPTHDRSFAYSYYLPPDFTQTDGAAAEVKYEGDVYPKTWQLSQLSPDLHVDTFLDSLARFDLC